MVLTTQIRLHWPKAILTFGTSLEVPSINVGSGPAMPNHVIQPMLQSLVFLHFHLHLHIELAKGLVKEFLLIAYLPLRATCIPLLFLQDPLYPSALVSCGEEESTRSIASSNTEVGMVAHSGTMSRPMSRRQVVVHSRSTESTLGAGSGQSSASASLLFAPYLRARSPQIMAPCGSGGSRGRSKRQTNRRHAWRYLPQGVCNN